MTRRQTSQAFRTTALAKAAPVERALIAHCLMDPKKLGEVASRVPPAAIREPFHSKVLELLVRLQGEGRQPSVETLVSILGDDEVVAGVNVRDYLRQTIQDNLAGLLTPWADVIETAVDQAHRGTICEIAADLSNGAALATSIADIAASAAERLEDLRAGLRQSRVLRYGAAEAGNIALAHLEGGASQPYVTTGLHDLDRLVGGWPIGELSIVAARPGMGKSCFATSCALRAAKADVRTHIFSLEMLGRQLGARMLTDLAYAHERPIAYDDILRRRIDDYQRRRLNDANALLTALPMEIDEQRGLGLADIASRVRRAANNAARAGRPLQLVIVDHAGLVRGSGRNDSNRVRELGEICDGLAVIAKEHNVALVALCQLNRGVEGRENKRPTLADLRDSGEIEEMASIVAFLYRAAYYLERGKSDKQELEAKRLQLIDETRHVLEISVAKNRNGRTGQIEAFVDIAANAVRNSDFARRVAA